MKRFRWVIIFGVLIGGCFTVEYVNHRWNDPTAHASTLSAYLTWHPSADQFAVVNVNGKQYVIAYGSMSKYSLVPPFGPPACVFDSSGRLVDWSSDIGDDPKFDERWNAQRSRAPGRTLSRSEVQRIWTTRPTG